MTTATLSRRIIRPVASPPDRRGVLIGFAATMAAGLLVLVGLSTALGVASGGAVLGGVSAGGVDLSGLSRAEAEARLAAELPSFAGTATIEVGRADDVLTFEELGRRYDIAATLDAALAVGRSGNPIADGITHLRALTHQTAVPVRVQPYDSEALAALSISVARDMSILPVEAAVTREGTTFELRPSRTGRVVDPAAVETALARALAVTDPGSVTVTVEASAAEPVVSTAEARAAAAAARDMTAALELTVPGAGEDEAPLALEPATIAAWVTFGPEGASDYAARIDATAAAKVIGGLADDVNRDPVDAEIGVAGTGLGNVIAGQDGRELNLEDTTEAVVAALRDRGGGAPVASLALAVDVTEPALTTEEAEAILPQMQLVSSWTTNYVPGDGNGYGANISIPAWDLDGYNLAPGEWFSFWDGIGPVTVERGYTYGGAIINGRSTQGVALAGGICSTSTTLFNAAMRAGLEIGERKAHYYYIDRYPVGLDATVSIFDDRVTDMTFRNDTEYPIVIRGYGSPGQVTFQIWSVPTGRTVALSNPIISNRRSAIETTQLDTSLAPGTSRRVEYPHHGFDASVTRTVYDADGSVLHQNTWFSPYRAVNGITLVGPAAAAPEPPPADEGETAGVGDAPPPEEQP